MLVVSIIPHTAGSTTFKNRNVGDRVNIEVDILSKYIEKHLRGTANKDMFEDTLVRTGYLPLGWIDN
jgi:riboflavin synthase